MVLVATSVAGAGWKPHPAALRPSQRAEITVGEIGSRLPDFSLRDLRGNEPSSADFKGKVVLVDFWATWRASRAKRLLDAYGNRGLVVLGFKFDTSDRKPLL